MNNNNQCYNKRAKINKIDKNNNNMKYGCSINRNIHNAMILADNDTNIVIIKKVANEKTNKIIKKSTNNNQVIKKSLANMFDKICTK